MTADGKYQWNVVTFGLATAVSTFQYLMSTVLTSSNNFAFTYLDDVLVFSETYEDHLHHLNVVFEKFQKHALKLTSVNVSFSNLIYITEVIGSQQMVWNPYLKSLKPSET